MSVYFQFSRFLKAIRDYFYKTDAIEVLTETLQDYPNLDSNIYPVELYVFNEKGEKLKKYLHTSPEYQMKKILSKYKKDIFQITKVFRNYEGSFKHKVEFLMLEWYRVNFNLHNLINDTHMLFIDVVSSLKKSPFFEFKGKKYDIRNYKIVSVEEAFKEYTGVDIYCIDSMNRFLKEKEPEFREKQNWEELFFHIYAFYVEPELGREALTFIKDYPPKLSALAKIKNGKGQRFEAYIGGIELVNGYYEENNPEEIKKRLEKDIKEKQKTTGKTYQIDNSFIESLKNLPECSGASLGLERLFMVINNLKDIRFI